MVVCLQQGADLHMDQLMLLPLTVSFFSKIQIGFTFLVLAHLASPGKRAAKRVCVCVYMSTCVSQLAHLGEKWRILLQQNFTAHNGLAENKLVHFGLKREYQSSDQWSY